MGDYNPNHPAVAGMEWVPIRSEPYPLNPDEEIGIRFHLATAVTVTTAGYVIDTPPSAISAQVPLVAVYRAGQEAATGPIRVVDLPVVAATVSGNAVVVGADTAVAALASPSDFRFVNLPTTSAAVDLGFAVDTATDLAGRRILGIELRYVAKKDTATKPSEVGALVAIQSATSSWAYGGLQVSQATATWTPPVDTLQLGEINPSAERYATDTTDRAPWTYQQLRRFAPASAAADRLTVRITGDQDVALHFAALQVVYCDESRVAFGGKASYTAGSFYTAGLNTVRLFDPASLSVGVALTAGEYIATVTLGHDDPSSLAGSRPLLARLRQLYPLPTHGGVVIGKATAGNPPVVESTDSLAPVVISTAAGVLPGVHAYGRQVAAPVYGATTAVQTVPAGGPGMTYRAVRCYARRHGATTAALTVRAVADPTVAASISPAQFDALPEIIDGWREVTLPLPGSGLALPATTSWELLAPGESSPNRWEILATRTPTAALTAASHGGDTSRLTWDDPAVAGGPAADTAADAALILAAPPPPVAGLAVADATLDLAPAGNTSCPPRTRVPAGLRYHRLSWTPPQVPVATDGFTRAVAGGWGTADLGGAWATSGGTSADFTVTAGTGGIHTLGSAGPARTCTLPITEAAVGLRCVIRISQLVTGAAATAGVVLRWHGIGQHVRCSIDVAPDRSLTAKVVQTSAGTATTVGQVPVVGTVHDPGTPLHLRVEAAGSWVRMACWPAGADEPAGWVLTAPVTVTEAGNVGTVSARDAANTNTNLPVAFADFAAERLAPAVGVLEVQRADDTDPTWQTIMRSSSAVTSGFNDYEARIGAASGYRIRVCDRSGFCSDWSSPVAATLPAPGVTGAGDAAGLLAFTSNHRQDGTANLAHTSVYERSPAMDVTFVEADTVTVQRMYGRDFQAVFHGRERGGERFTRTLLVQAAAVSTRTAGRLQNLRDLAWADLPNVCVRDETGARWWAAVTVASAHLTAARGPLLAQVEIIEVAGCPDPADPAGQ